jgi:hypothetical protein
MGLVLVLVLEMDMDMALVREIERVRRQSHALMKSRITCNHADLRHAYTQTRAVITFNSFTHLSHSKLLQHLYLLPSRTTFLQN